MVANDNLQKSEKLGIAYLLMKFHKWVTCGTEFKGDLIAGGARRCLFKTFTFYSLHPLYIKFKSMFEIDFHSFNVKAEYHTNLKELLSGTISHFQSYSTMIMDRGKMVDKALFHFKK